MLALPAGEKSEHRSIFTPLLHPQKNIDRHQSSRLGDSGAIDVRGQTHSRWARLCNYHACFLALTELPFLLFESSPLSMRAKAGRNFIEGNDHHLLMLVASARPRGPSAIFRVNIRLGIPFKRRAELFITPRPVCGLPSRLSHYNPVGEVLMSSAKLYVGNLSYDTSEASLRTLFAPHGEVTSVNLITDRDSGRAKGLRFRGNGHT